MEKEKRKDRYMDKPFIACGGYSITFHMTWHGHMQFCGFVANPHVQIAEPINMKQAWEDMLEQTRRIVTPEQCATCEDYEFCKRCPGLLASESGNPSEISPSFCKQAADLHKLYRKLKAESEKK
jgi:radical SAM protein with 4Fe4S-binding SPASM domain